MRHQRAQRHIIARLALRRPDLPHAVRVPRKAFDAAVEYAVQVSELYLYKMRERTVNLDGLRYLEIGPGTDFALQLIIASHGAEVTLADKYLADWDQSYHPHFYEALLKRWDRTAEAVHRALQCGGYSGVIRLVREPIENVASIGNASIEFVQSNAVLEHVTDLGQSIAELARVTLPGGIPAHQVDFRFHSNFDRPLDHLLLSRSDYKKLCLAEGTVHGTATRMPENGGSVHPVFLGQRDRNQRDCGIGIHRKYTSAVSQRKSLQILAIAALRQTGACLWFVRQAENGTT